MKVGTHLVVDFFGLNPLLFENVLSKTNYDKFDIYIEKELKKNGMNLLKKSIHHFDNQNGAFTALYLLSESHLSFHSWPEHSYIACDIFTCGKCEPQMIIDELIIMMKPTRYTVTEISRGEDNK